MQRLHIPNPTLQILPEDRISHHGLKSHSIIIRHIAINPLTQRLLLLRPFQLLQAQAGEVSAATSAIGLDVDEERRLDVAIDIRTIRVPIIVIFVLIRDAVSLGDERFDESSRAVGGEIAGSLFNTLDDAVPGKSCGARGAVVWVYGNDSSVI